MEQPEQKQLAITQAPFRDLSLAEIQNVAKALFASGIFKDTGDAAVAFAKILAGQEMGLGPFSAMQEISFISGKPNLSATAKAAKIKESGKYNYRVVEIDNTHCILEFSEYGKPVGTIEYNEEMAKLGGEYNRNQNYRSHPDDMYFAGALRKGQRRFAPDALSGIATYDREEFVEGQVIYPEGQKEDKGKSEPTPEPIVDAPEAAPEPEETKPTQVTPAQLRRIMAILRSKNITNPSEQKDMIYDLAKVKSRTELTTESASDLIAKLEDLEVHEEPVPEGFDDDEA